MASAASPLAGGRIPCTIIALVLHSFVTCCLCGATHGPSRFAAVGASLFERAQHGPPLFRFETELLDRSSFPSVAAASHLDFDEVIVSRDDNGIRPRNATQPQCKVFPGDPTWPSAEAWDLLNQTVGGALISTVPQAAPCYPGPLYNPSLCADMTANWTNSYTHVVDPVEMLSPVYQGLTCQPPQVYESKTGNCTLGGYPSYVVNVSTVAHVQAAVNFARNNGIRLVIKNTGHDFSGKSGGAGALSIWTHYLKDTAFIPNYEDETLGYSGPAIKAGSGVEAYELFKFAHDNGVVAVGGEGQTVGVMGGYILGGGHSPLSSVYGMAADSVLAMEVVTSDGQFVSANAANNSDLFWALRGGGGSTYGVVTSVTVKGHPDMPISTMSVVIPSVAAGPNATFAAIRAFFDYFIPNSDAGIYTYWFILPGANGTFTFLISPFFAPNKTLAEAQALMNPWLDRLPGLGVNATPAWNEYDDYYSAWTASFALEAMSSTDGGTSSRLWPRSNWENSTLLDATFAAIRDAAEDGDTIIAFNVAPDARRAGPNMAEAVNPAWRNTVLHAIANFQWPAGASDADILALRKDFTNVRMKRWRDLSPGAGAYLSESDRMEPNFQESFYGSNYDKLLALKQKYDPMDVFWAVTAVGSENWAVDSVDGLPNENGRLCQVLATELTG